MVRGGFDPLQPTAGNIISFSGVKKDEKFQQTPNCLML